MNVPRETRRCRVAKAAIDADAARRVFDQVVGEGGVALELIDRFTGAAHEALMRLLFWLTPVTIRDAGPAAIELNEGR